MLKWYIKGGVRSLRTIARGLVCVGILCSLPPHNIAAASTIINRDGREHKLTVIKGSTRQDYTLAAKGEIANICTEGCIVRLNDDVKADYILEGGELVSVEDGLMYFEGELGGEDATVNGAGQSGGVAPKDAPEKKGRPRKDNGP